MTVTKERHRLNVLAATADPVAVHELLNLGATVAVATEMEPELLGLVEEMGVADSTLDLAAKISARQWSTPKTTVREPNEAQRTRIDEAKANFAESDFVLEEWRVIDGAEFLDGQEPPADHLYVEFRYRDPNLAEDLQDRPGREVHVYGPAGEVLDCHDFG